MKTEDMAFLIASAFATLMIAAAVAAPSDLAQLLGLFTAEQIPQ